MHKNLNNLQIDWVARPKVNVFSILVIKILQ